jgi:hypothetical protein
MCIFILGSTRQAIATVYRRASQRSASISNAPLYPLHYGTIEFIANAPTGLDVVDQLTAINALPEPPPGLRPLFIFSEERLPELEIIKQRYPGGRLQEFRSKPAGHQILMYIYEPAS